MWGTLWQTKPVGAKDIWRKRCRPHTQLQFPADCNSASSPTVIVLPTQQTVTAMLERNSLSMRCAASGGTTYNEEYSTICVTIFEYIPILLTRLWRDSGSLRGSIGAYTRIIPHGRTYQFYKPVVHQSLLPAVELYIIGIPAKINFSWDWAIDNRDVTKYISEQGKRIRQTLLEYATRKKQLVRWTVNEQNEKALASIYIGFQIGRDETDGMGKPYPITILQPEKQLSKK